MADTQTPPADQGRTPQAGAAEAEPRLLIQTQYIKDLSFENPRAPVSLEPGRNRPEISVRVDVRAEGLGSDRYEVLLVMNVEAQSGEGPVFLLELTYGGVFALLNIPADSLQPLLLIECPRLLFPFARRIVADASRDGGFPPLLLDPIDFVQLFRRRQQLAQQAGEASRPAAAAAPSLAGQA